MHTTQLCAKPCVRIASILNSLRLLLSQVIDRSGGVVFMEQLAPILNPREAPPEWYRESAAGGFSRNTGANGGITTTEVVGGDAPLLRLLFELNGTPEVRWTLSRFFSALRRPRKSGGTSLGAPHSHVRERGSTFERKIGPPCKFSNVFYVLSVDFVFRFNGVYVYYRT